MRSPRSFSGRRALLPLGILLLAASPSARATESYRAFAAAVPARLATADFVGRADPEERLLMSITLQPQHQSELDALIEAQQQPGSPAYHRWLSPDEFGARFGADADTYAAVADWLRQQGFAVRTWPARSRIDFVGTAAQVESSFSVRMNAYHHRGRRVLANADAPQLPDRFAAHVQALRLNTLRVADPVVRLTGAESTIDTLAPVDAYTAYGVDPLLAEGIDGGGQTVAIAARSDFNASDVTGFQSLFGVPVRTPQKVFPGTNPGIGSANSVCAGIRNPQQRADCLFGEEVEVLLDVEWASAMAPGANILADISDADVDGALADIVNHHPEAKLVSVSFGLCERLEPSLVPTLEPLYQQAATQGQTVLVAAGNSGADGCGDGGAPGINGLASSASVTAVGGTALDPGFDANGDATGRASEIVWNDGDGASGGGRSIIVPKPAYQVGPGVPSDGFRDQPDIALMASPSQTGYVTMIEGDLLIVGGTSAATPSWAGIIALMNDAKSPTGSGAINALLYDLGARQYGGSGAAVFHDITSGDNTFDGVTGFTAGTGYDLASGLGSPDAAALVEAVAAPTCMGDCNGDGAVDVEELVTIVHIALGMLPASQCIAVTTDAQGLVSVDQIVAAIDRALHGC